MLRALLLIMGLLCLILITKLVVSPDRSPTDLTDAEQAEVDALALPIPEAWTGDFDGMKARRQIRILVPYSRTFFGISRGQQFGISYELGSALARWLDRNHPVNQKSQRWRVMFIPVDRDKLLPRLQAGYGDIAAGGLTITESRLAEFDFSPPFARDIHEVVVTAPDVPGLESLEQLSGRTVMVRASSSYYEHLLTLNTEFGAQGLAPVDIQAADENLEAEDLLEMVDAGLIPATVVDRYIALSWKPLLNDMVINDTVFLREDSAFAWVIRKDSPLLRQALEGFVKEHRMGTLFGNMLKNKYIEGGTELHDAISEEELQKFNALEDLFRKHADTYHFDYLLLMAQAYQESGLDQQARSRRGAVGVMQLLPSTAASPGVEIKGIDKSADRNIEAGCKYLRLLVQTYLDDADIPPLEQTLMSFAAYNAGPGNLLKFRRLAQKSGLDPNVWFDNVELAAARIVGRETVDYVDNIYKYYIAYKLASRREAARKAAIQARLNAAPPQRWRPMPPLQPFETTYTSMSPSR